MRKLLTILILSLILLNNVRALDLPTPPASPQSPSVNESNEQDQITNSDSNLNNIKNEKNKIKIIWVVGIIGILLILIGIFILTERYFNNRKVLKGEKIEETNGKKN